MNTKPNKTKTVLIALDYDPTAQKIAEGGYSLAKAMEAGVILIHVISDPVYYATREYSPIMGFAGYIEPVSMQNGVEELKRASLEFLDKSRQHLGDTSIQTLVVEGEFADSIMKAAKNHHADMIVLGSHSRKWLEKIVMGSVTEQILNHTSIPLYIIPTKKH